MQENFAEAGIRNLEMIGADVLSLMMTMGTVAVDAANQPYG